MRCRWGWVIAVAFAMEASGFHTCFMRSPHPHAHPSLQVQSRPIIARPRGLPQGRGFWSTTCVSVQTQTGPGAGAGAGAGAVIENSSLDTAVYKFNQLAWRILWGSWWIQIVLSVVAGVILAFTNFMRRTGVVGMMWAGGFAFSVFGVSASFLNALWTFNTTRLSRSIKQRRILSRKICPAYHRAFSVSVRLSVLGMAVTLIGAEQIVGMLASKVLSIPAMQPLFAGLPSGQLGFTAGALQPLDIFLVQANINIIVAHFAPLVLGLWMQERLRALERELNPTSAPTT